MAAQLPILFCWLITRWRRLLEHLCLLLQSRRRCAGGVKGGGCFICILESALLDQGLLVGWSAVGMKTPDSNRLLRALREAALCLTTCSHWLAA